MPNPILPPFTNERRIRNNKIKKKKIFNFPSLKETFEIKKRNKCDVISFNDPFSYIAKQKIKNTDKYAQKWANI